MLICISAGSLALSFLSLSYVPCVDFSPCIGPQGGADRKEFLQKVSSATRILMEITLEKNDIPQNLLN